jgi:hypothetical protein
LVSHRQNRAKKNPKGEEREEILEIRAQSEEQGLTVFCEEKKEKREKRGREVQKKEKTGKREKSPLSPQTSIYNRRTIYSQHTRSARAKKKEEEEEKFYAQHAQIEVEGAAVQKNRNIHTRTHST